MAFIGIFVVGISLLIRWGRSGALQFELLEPSAVVEGRLATSEQLLAYRLLAAITATYFVVKSPMSHYRSATAAARMQSFYGLEVFCTCTMWTWFAMFLYFWQVFFVSAWWHLTGILPSQRYAVLLWVAFEVCFSLAWLVFLAVWFGLIPVLHWLGLHKFVDGLLEPFVLGLHNVNLVLMECELFCARWDMVPYHAVFTLLFLMPYVPFYWFMFYNWNVRMYFFLDPNHGGVPWLLVLIGFVFFGFFAAMKQVALVV